MLRKLAIGGSIVWASPMIASRASALMPPSQCVNNAVLNWTTLYPGANNNPNLTNPVAIVVPGTGVTVTISSTIVGTTAMSRNFQVQPSPHGGITGKSLMFEQYPWPNTNSSGTGSSTSGNGSGGQTITISFSTTVRNIRFTLTDIDNDQGNWSDRVTFNGGTLTPPTSYVRGSDLIGVGATGNGTGGMNTGDGNGGSTTTTGAFRNGVNDNNLDDTEANGNLAVTYAGPTATVRFRYWNGGEGAGTSSNQRINLSNITFDTCPEGVNPNLVQSPATVEPEAGVGGRHDQRVAPSTPGRD